MILGASYPFFSPNGQWVGLTADGKLKKVSLATETVETVCDVEAGPGRGGAWGEDDTIYFVPSATSGIWTVPASWVQRFRSHGETGLADRSRAPQRCPRATPPEVVSKILYLRQQYHFGAGRIADYLRRFHQLAVARAISHDT